MRVSEFGLMVCAGAAVTGLACRMQAQPCCGTLTVWARVNFFFIKKKKTLPEEVIEPGTIDIFVQKRSIEATELCRTVSALKILQNKYR